MAKSVPPEQLNLGDPPPVSPADLPFWNQIVDRAEVIKPRIAKVFSMIQDGAFELWPVYDRMFSKYEREVALLRLLAPGRVDWFGGQVKSEADSCERKLHLLWDAAGDSPVVLGRFEKLLVRYTLLYRQAEALLHTNTRRTP